MGGRPRGPGEKTKVSSKERSWSLGGRRASGPRRKNQSQLKGKKLEFGREAGLWAQEKKQKSVVKKELGVWVGGGPLGPGEKTKVS